MAELLLYGNDKEPEFPFEAIRGMAATSEILREGEVSWLEDFLQEHIVDPGEDLQPMLNTVLVFARARTSTVQSASSWKKVSLLVKRLNIAAKAVETSHHRIELVRYPGQE